MHREIIEKYNYRNVLGHVGFTQFSIFQDNLKDNILGFLEKDQESSSREPGAKSWSGEDAWDGCQHDMVLCLLVIFVYCWQWPGQQCND